MIFRIFLVVIIVQVLFGLITGEATESSFGNLSTPDDILDWFQFFFSLALAIIELLFDAVTWSFIPLPTLVRVILVSFTSFVVVVWLFRYIIPPLVTVISKIVDALVPG